MEIYQVGGSLRDELIGRPPSDRDYVVIGASETEFRKAFPAAVRVGRRQAVYYVNGDEYTLSRASGIMEDLHNRDLTVNSLAKDSSGRLYSHPRAMEDIDRRILRPLSLRNFIDDPLRVLRAARLAAGLPAFSPHPSLLTCMAEVAARGLLGKLAAERVGNETRKAYAAIRPDRFLNLLSETGALAPWFSEMQNAHRIPAGPVRYHTGSLLEHSGAVMKILAGDALAVWMGYCHDLGKTVTREEDYPHHYGHEQTGARLASAAAERLCLPIRYREAGQVAARYHMQAGRYPQLRPATRVDLLMTLSRKKLMKALFRLVQADKGKDHYPQAAQDLDIIRQVHLPEKYRNRGRESGMRLRELRCQALAGKNPVDREG